MATKVTDLLDAAGIAYEIYDGIKPNPTIENVTAGVEACKVAGADVIVAVGGGSPSIQVRRLLLLLRTLNSPMYAALKVVAPTKNPLFANHRCYYHI